MLNKVPLKTTEKEYHLQKHIQSKWFPCFRRELALDYMEIRSEKLGREGRVLFDSGELKFGSFLRYADSVAWVFT
jgi:hypothetical protein